MPDLRTVKTREKLKPNASKEPHWQVLSAGRYLGFRPSTAGGQGIWLARFNDASTGKKPGRSLGDFGELPPGERYNAAKTAAEEWFRHLSLGGSTEDLTVGEACAKYAGDADPKGPAEKASNPDAARRFRRYLYGDALSRIPLSKLREQHVKDWRLRLEATPAVISSRKAGGPRAKSGTEGAERVIRTRERAHSTINRDMVCVRAALNAALRRGEITTALAWQTALEPLAGADNRREVYLDREQRRALLDALPPDAAAFARGLCLLPLRPGALAALPVAALDKRAGTLRIARDKAKAGRSILLPPQTAALLKEQTRGKLPGAPMFTRSNSQPWTKDSWKGPIREAALKAGLPAGTTAYALRHSTITDLVVAGVPLLTIAQLAGTSVRMIEKHYGHLTQDAARDALAGLAL
jgi:integrase